MDALVDTCNYKSMYKIVTNCTAHNCVTVSIYMSTKYIYIAILQLFTYSYIVYKLLSINSIKSLELMGSCIAKWLYDVQQ